MRSFLSAFLLSVLPLATAVPQGLPLSTGPYGGYVQHLARDSSGRVYAATFMGGIYRTTNDGDIWEDLYNDTLLIDVRTLAIGSGGTIYAGLDPGFLRSTDDGASWQKLNNLLNTRSVVSILILPGGTLLAGTISNGVYRSTDNGASFSSSDDSLTNSYVWSLAATPSGDTVFAATYGGGVFRSINGGSTWSPVNTGLTQNLATWVGIAPDGALFACAGSSIFRSTDNGDNWTDLSAPPASYRSIAFTSGAYYAPATSGVFTGGGVFVSTDGGATWSQVLSPGVTGGCLDLAIRTDRIYIQELPTLTRQAVELFLDIESVPDQDFYYLIGLTITRQGETITYHPFWANTIDDEEKTWQAFLSIVNQYPEAPIYHYGSYETRSIAKLAKRYETDVEVLNKRLVNIHKQIYGRVYFPLYSNRLKEIGNFIGATWTHPDASGLQSIVWRYKWADTRDDRYDALENVVRDDGRLE